MYYSIYYRIPYRNALYRDISWIPRLFPGGPFPEPTGGVVQSFWAEKCRKVGFWLSRVVVPGIWAQSPPPPLPECKSCSSLVGMH